jgi:fatty acid amide hydrolase
MLYQRLLFADGMAWARRALGKSRRDWRINLIVRSLALPRILHALGAWELSLFGQTHLANNLRRLGASSVAAYWKLLEQRADYRARFIQSLDDGRFDAVISPPDALPALTHGASFLLSDALSYSSLYNLLGMPAGVVAVTRVGAGEESDRATGWDVVERAARKVETGSAGMPVGVQVAARHWREDVVLALMSILEEHFQQQTDYPRIAECEFRIAD